MQVLWKQENPSVDPKRVVQFCFHLFQKRSSTKRMVIPATDFPVAGLASMTSNMFSNAISLCDRARDSSEMSFVSCPCVEHFFVPKRLTRLG